MRRGISSHEGRGGGPDPEWTPQAHFLSVKARLGLPGPPTPPSNHQRFLRVLFGTLPSAEPSRPSIFSRQSSPPPDPDQGTQTFQIYTTVPETQGPWFLADIRPFISR